jgi:Ca-activated chloride channel family protein
MMRCISSLAIALFAVCLVFVNSIHAQRIGPPRLVVTHPDNSEPLKLTKLKVQVRIFGRLAETKMTMTFFNPHRRAMAGDLLFPLPEGATVTGYALDVRGAMVEGVVVKKRKARVVFEKEVRKGVDPGIVEWVKGNHFRTRVFPILGQGTRTVMVKYLSELVSSKGGSAYHLPLKFDKTVDEFALRIKVVKPASPPVYKQSGWADLRFKKSKDIYVAETKFKEFAPKQDLIVALPKLETRKVIVQKSRDGQTYFAINDLPPSLGLALPTAKKAHPQRITILWDASGSRGDSDHKREIGLISDYFTKLGADKIHVDLILFRNEAEKATEFVVKKGDSRELISALETVAYDGGTQLAAAGPQKGAKNPDFFMLFTDGLSNFGKEDPTGFKAPVYVFSEGAGSNHPFLTYLAQKTGGIYFNLTKIPDNEVISRLGRSAYSFLSTEFDNKFIAETYPRSARPVIGRFSLTGKLLGKAGNIILNYGVGGKVLKSVKYKISSGDALEGEQVRQFWALNKIQELIVFPKKNKEQLVTMGRKHGLVTPGTSLIVLETLSQYVEHRIPPPASAPKMRSSYFAQVKEKEHEESTRKTRKLNEIIAHWKQRVAWWNCKFTYPKDFKYQPPQFSFPSTWGYGNTYGLNRGVMPKYGPPGTPPPPPPIGGPPGLKSIDRNMIKPVPRQLLRVRGPLSYGNPPYTPRGRWMRHPQDSRLYAPVLAGEPGIFIKPWDPETPYLTALSKAGPSEYLSVYLAQREQFAKSPAFFLDCADFFFKKKKTLLGVRVLSNIAEMDLENSALLRILGHKLAQQNLLKLSKQVFEKVLDLLPEQPQSYRNLSLVLAQLGEYPKAIELLYHVVMNRWDRPRGIEIISLMEINRLIP